MKAFQEDPANKGKTIEDANKSICNSLPTDLMRKEGKVTVSVRTDKGKREITLWKSLAKRY